MAPVVAWRLVRQRHAATAFSGEGARIFEGRWNSAGVPVVYRCYDALAHGFTAFTGAVPAADIACREVAGLVREGLEGRIC